MKSKDKNTDIKIARPFVKWVGGKARLIPELSKYFPDKYNAYYEPFVGGGALFFSLQPKVAHISDLNSTLIATYKIIKSDVQSLIDALNEIQTHYYQLSDIDEKKKYYLSLRDEFNQLHSDDFRKAVLLIFINKTCFNGMYRENSKGGFNVPFGKHDKPKICDADNLKAISKSLTKTEIKCSSYEEITKSAKAGDFVYFDPPYHPLNPTSSFTSYQAGGFSARDQEKLRDEFKRLSELGCKVMLSNSDAPLINELYADFNINKIYAARSINSKGDGRGKILEVVVTNY
jgi:DNA adenine methylase